MSDTSFFKPLIRRKEVRELAYKHCKLAKWFMTLANKTLAKRLVRETTLKSTGFIAQYFFKVYRVLNRFSVSYEHMNWRECQNDTVLPACVEKIDKQWTFIHSFIYLTFIYLFIFTTTSYSEWWGDLRKPKGLYKEVFSHDLVIFFEITWDWGQKNTCATTCLHRSSSLTRTLWS